MTTKATFTAAVRWLIVAMTALMLFEPRLAMGFGSSMAQKQTCTACVRCQCCVKESPASPAPPLSAPASNRASAQKDFQVLAVVILLAPVRATPSVNAHPASSVPLPAAAPLYERHCAYLI